jgi:prevent-host-death family protein
MLLTTSRNLDKLNKLSLLNYILEDDMQTVNIHEAKTHLSRLIDQAAKGNPFIIAKAGKPMVKVIPLSAEEHTGEGRLGFMAGEILAPDDFDTMGSKEIISLFEGRAL